MQAAKPIVPLRIRIYPHGLCRSTPCSVFPFTCRFCRRRRRRRLSSVGPPPLPGGEREMQSLFWHVLLSTTARGLHRRFVFPAPLPPWGTSHPLLLFTRRAARWPRRWRSAYRAWPSNRSGTDTGASRRGRRACSTAPRCLGSSWSARGENGLGCQGDDGGPAAGLSRDIATCCRADRMAGTFFDQRLEEREGGRMLCVFLLFVQEDRVGGGQSFIWRGSL